MFYIIFDGGAGHRMQRKLDGPPEAKFIVQAKQWSGENNGYTARSCRAIHSDF